MGVIWRVLVPAMVYELLLTAVAGMLPGTERMTVVLISAILGIFLFGIWFREEQKMSWKQIFHLGFSWHDTGDILVFGISSCVLVNNLIEASRISWWFPQVQQVTDALYTPPFLLQMAAVGIVIPIAEELVFRGMIYRRLREACSTRTSVIGSALVFAVFHGNLVQAVYAFILGWMMAWVYERYKSLWAPVGFHVAANLCSVWMTRLVSQYEVNSADASFLMVTVLSAGLVLWSVIKMKEVRF